MIPTLLPDTTCLSICSSKSRPTRCADMISSYNATRTGKSELVVYVSDNDPKLNEYKIVFSRLNQKHIIGPDRNMVQVLNYLATEAYPKMNYYQEINDDHIYHTLGWDEIMMSAIDFRKGFGVAFGKTDYLPNATMWGGPFVRAIGYIYPPIFNRTYCDNMMVNLMDATNTAIYIPLIDIEHKHHLWGKAPIDATYVQGEIDGVTGRDHYAKWVKEIRDIDIQNIKEGRRNV